MTDQMLFMSKYVDKKRPPIYGKGLRVAIYQCACKLGDAEANIAQLRVAILDATAMRAEIIVTPELFLLGYNPTKKVCHANAVSRDSELMKGIANLAKEHDIAILLPYAERGDANEFYDSMVLYDKHGTELLNYRKTHLWGPYERELFDFGYVGINDPFVVAKVNGISIGVLNCYEAEFPELPRILALKGAQVILIPTAADEWQTFDLDSFSPNKGSPYPDVSKTVIPTRAFENNVFCSYINHCGSEYGTDGKKRAEFLGNSVIAAPNGDLIMKAPAQEVLMVADLIPADYVASHPTGTNNIKNRRVDLYGYLVQREIDYNDENPDRVHIYPNKPE